MKPRTASMLPPSCPACRPFGGRWRRAANGGLERCACARGVALSAGKVKRVMGQQRSVNPAPNASDGQYKAGKSGGPPVHDGKHAATGED